MPGGRLTDLTGMRFGRLLVVSQGPTDGRGAQWHCVCDCGAKKLAKAKRLVQGNTRSCGCLKREANQRRFENEATREKLRESMLRSWENGGRRTAQLAKAVPKPPKPPKPAPPAERPRFSEKALDDLDKVWK